MVNLLDKLLEICSSLKLAIFLILSLAVYLAFATVYEAQYGTRAVQDLIYGSQPFVLLMAMLSINVMAAVLVRYPWKRKQTGFIITHAGIEILLLGCLISFRLSVDGRVSLTPGQRTEAINLNDEDVDVTMPDAGGTQRRHVVPIHLWKEAGYPGLARFAVGEFSGWLENAADSLGMTGLGDSIHHDLPINRQVQWPTGHTVIYPMGPGATLTVLDWLPAAVPETILQPTPDGFPAVMVHLGGHLPNGMTMDQDVPMIADTQGDGMKNPFGPMLELNLWKARSADEANEFMNPPAPEKLPEMGQVAIYLDGKRYAIDVTKDALNQEVPLAGTIYKTKVAAYTLQPGAAALPEGHGQAAMDNQPIDPEVEFWLIGPQVTKKYLLSAWHPQFMAHLEGDAASGHGAAAPDDPVIWYWHPQAYATAQGGTLGRLWMIQSPDGKLFARKFELPQAGKSFNPPFEVQVGKELADAWLNISFTITQHVPSGVAVSEFRPAHVAANQIEEHERAIKVALDIDGTHQESWLALGDGPSELNTARGPIDVAYAFREYELGFGIGLNHAEQVNDPGSNQPAAWSSEVAIQGAGKPDGTQTITMNEPITVNGLTFYQAGFTNDQIITSTLSVRYDPGRVIKYLGCLGIVGGIFTMFYMKAYFQKTPAPAAKPQTAGKAKSGQRLTGAVKA